MAGVHNTQNANYEGGEAGRLLGVRGKKGKKKYQKKIGSPPETHLLGYKHKKCYRLRSSPKWCLPADLSALTAVLQLIDELGIRPRLTRSATPEGLTSLSSSQHELWSENSIEK